jgi:hypothetical protein
MIEKDKHYSLHGLTLEQAFPGVAHTAPSYIRLIGVQATRGNFLTRDSKADKRRGEHPFKGSDVINFVNNIK